MLYYLLVVYSTYMRVKNLGIVLLTFTILSICTVKAYAKDASFSFYPSSGVVKDIDEGFTVDILIDSGDYDISKARAVVSFNPKVIQLKKAYRNDSLFEKWDDTESSTDNRNGIVMLTGVTANVEAMPFYFTQGEPDIFARLEFDIVTTKSTTPIILEFEYSGTDEELNSVILKSGTPEINVLTTAPLSAQFTMDGDDIPDTALDMNVVGIVGGIILILIGAFVSGSNPDIFRKRRGTIVLSE